MKYPKLKVLDNPMQLILDAVKPLGYAPLIDISKYHQCLHVKEWIAYKYNIYTWVIPQHDNTFIPYYRDMNTRDSYTRQYEFSECPMQSLVEGLLFAVGSIE